MRGALMIVEREYASGKEVEDFIDPDVGV